MRVSYLFSFVLTAFLACTPPVEPEKPLSIRVRKTTHKKITADLHVDTIYQIMKSQGKLNLLSLSLEASLPRLREGGINLEMFAIWPDPRRESFRGFPYVLRAAEAFRQLVQKLEGIELVTSSQEARRIVDKGKIAALLSLEGAHALEGRLENLTRAYDAGIRAISLTWNNSNSFADGIKGPRLHGGLSPLGRKLVQAMNQLGIMIDVSHASPETFREVVALSKAPVFASHSNAKAVASHPRNLSDRQIKALAEKGGIIGINFHTPFLRSDGKRATVEDIFRHIEHIVHIAGVEAVALGSDFDGMIVPPQDLPHAGMLKKLRARLRQAFTQEQVDLIFGGNFIRFFSQVEQMKKTR